MVGKICEITDCQSEQLKLGHPKLEVGTFVLVTDDLGGGFFYALSDSGQSLVFSEYLAVCQACTTSES